MLSCWSKTSFPFTSSLRSGGVFSVEITEKKHGFVAFVVSGPGVEQVFQDEAGGYRWQRVPPTEGKSRVQTSTITVAVLPEPGNEAFEVHERDLEWTTTRGSGPGGQNRNKVETVAVVRHKPTGITVRAESERSQYRNKVLALRVLRAKLHADFEHRLHIAESGQRKQQIGSGQRGDKRRTVRVRDGSVKDHVTGRTWELRHYLNGQWQV